MGVGVKEAGRTYYSMCYDIPVGAYVFCSWWGVCNYARKGSVIQHGILFSNVTSSKPLHCFSPSSHEDTPDPPAAIVPLPSGWLEDGKDEVWQPLSTTHTELNLTVEVDVASFPCHLSLKISLLRRSIYGVPKWDTPPFIPRVSPWDLFSFG
jgi:hypothetical protein